MRLGDLGGANAADFDDDEEAAEQKGVADELNPLLLEACRRNDTEEAIQLIEKGAHVDYEDSKQWSALTWAACNGNVSLTRHLLSCGAADIYRDKSRGDRDDLIAQATLPTTPGIAASQGPREGHAGGARASDTKMGAAGRSATRVAEGGDDRTHHKRPRRKHTPLHWAAFKGHLRVLWLLLRANLDVSTRDALGNTVLHSAAAGGDLTTVKCVLSQGIDISCKNDRGHKALELATAPAVKSLLERAMATLSCKITHKQFSYKVLRFMCSWTEEFFSEEAVIKTYAHAEVDSQDKEKPVTWSQPVKSTIQEAEHQLSNAYQLNVEAPHQLSSIKQALEGAKDKPVDVKLYDQCIRMKAKLESEIALSKAMDLPAIEDVETFFGAMATLKEAQTEALKHEADSHLLSRATALVRRLKAECDLTRTLGKKTSLPAAASTAAFRPSDSFMRVLEEQLKVAKEEQATDALLQRADRLLGTLRSQKSLHGRVVEVAPACALKSLLGEEGIPDYVAATLPSWHANSEAFEAYLEEYRKNVSEAEHYDVPPQLLEQAKSQLGILETQLVEKKQLEEETRLKAEKKKKKK
ncbi:unnamed protein product [Vitrella brassicaformis CCMP3155]|uniref:Uncharacterized protein n=1 Tax=Vitrella brassicaformis (strain CCMP3155) TaxID=1169540 RepID=A0A0G4H4A2_VITBC|nr:unnamed protein product [Vitrella brassicaformis CCMP3155]|eukprot:CEM38591.1 unnamed protein product [Vitrella brassicaformis CCMP3155]